MDSYDRCTNLGKKILPIVLPSMVEAENFSDHPRAFINNNTYFWLINSIISSPYSLNTTRSAFYLHDGLICLA